MSAGQSAHGRVVVIMPARNSEKTLENTLREIPPGFVDQIILVDNASRDGTVALAERLGLSVIRHPVDRGFGGSIKTLIRAALAAGADFVIELHPDNQYDAGDIPALLDAMGAHRHAVVMGSRFLPADKPKRGGMPWWKILGNRALTFANNWMLGQNMSEFHSGLRVYSGEWLRSVPLDGFSDDFKLSFQLFARAVKDGWSIAEIPTACRYFDEASSNPLKGSIVYGLGTLAESFGVLRHRLGMGRARTRTS